MESWKVMTTRICLETNNILKRGCGSRITNLFTHKISSGISNGVSDSKTKVPLSQEKGGYAIQKAYKTKHDKLLKSDRKLWWIRE